MRKGFTVFTNDPARAKVKLVVVGKVKGHISLSSSYIRFMGKEGQPLSKTITIKPLNSHTFSIQDVQAKEGKHLKIDLKPMGGNGSEHGYQLVVHNTMHSAGTYRDLITIKTDSQAKPTLRIPVSARIHKDRDQNQTRRQ